MTQPPNVGTPASSVSPWSPFRHPVFRMLWIASLASNIATWMREVGAGWLMTSLAPSPLLVALVQAANSLPVFLLALPAGALADIMDRRRYLIAAHVWMTFAAMSLSVATLLDVMTPGLLLLFSFALGIGMAMSMPAWGAIMPEIVSRADLHGAMALNAINMNIARAIGPALAGFIVAASGPGAVFVLNVVAFLGVSLAFVAWKRQVPVSTLPAERLVSATQAAVRYAVHAPVLQGVLIRAAAFFAFASASWALLPLIVRQQLSAGANVYGVLLGCFGVGAVIGGFVLPRLQARLQRDTLVVAASVLYAATLLALAYLRNLSALGVAMFLSGGAWIAGVPAFFVAAQAAVPAWIRARGLGLLWVVFMGGMAAGSAMWGQLATVTSMAIALTVAAAGLLVAAFATRRFSLSSHEHLDLTPSSHWAMPEIVVEPEPDRGPVLVTVEYWIESAQTTAFVAAMQTVRRIRRRDGAFFWELFSDVEEPSRFVECFMTESWLEHMRQHERVTVADRDVEEQVLPFHIGSEPPKVTHFVAGALR